MSVRSYFFALSIIILLAPTPVFATVILSEVAIAGAKASDEFAELYNSSDTAVNLSGWSLRRKSVSDMTATGSSLKSFGSTDSIPAHGYFLWANSASMYKDHADATTGSSLSDNNSLALYDKDDTLIDSLTWGTGHALPFAPTQFGNPAEKESFVRDPVALTWSKTISLTPTNSRGELFVVTDETVGTGTKPSLYQLFINEVLPNPKEKGDAGEFIELYHPGMETIDLSGWELRDAPTTGKYVFPDGTTLSALSYLVITDKEFSLSLNNSHETLSLSDSQKRLVHRVQYEKTKEGVSLNLVAGVLRGARKPTPGAANSENTDPVTKERVPKKGHRNFAIEFRARGKDTDGDKLKFTWDFGDGHKSFKENTSHKYVKSGRYTITLTTDDGIDTTRETFDIKIEKYAAPKVRIVSLLPNPKGNDSDLEWIEIENREKREINLKGFSIATGTKKKSITNHPIREDFIIPPKSVRRLTRAHSLFTLGNERGHVELRTPDGKAIQHLKYKFEKSLADDTLLRKEKGQSLVTITTPAEPIEESAAEDPSTAPSEETEATTNVSDETAAPTPTSETMGPEDVPLPVEGAHDPAQESIKSSSEFSVLFQKLHLSRATFPLSLFPFELFESDDFLANWQSSLNGFLNDWLTESSVATKEAE
ncbi:MAG: lamin tail domain-containing protein [Candidatus Moraniibacteriota bacterium]|nr:MAG: lamin tail domain-containing protein [Candidatus Moranbacteria bacterium]